jgi:hypothetical protein
MAEPADASAPLRARIEDVVAASRDLRRVLDDLDGTAAGLLDALEQGRPMLEVYREAQLDQVRNRIYAAMRTFDESLQATRAVGIRLLVEDGLTLSEVARLMGRSRQFVSRLYHAAAD